VNLKGIGKLVTSGGVPAMLCLASGISHAQNQCASGVYQQLGLSPTYYSVHVNGETVIAISLSYMPTNGITFSNPGIGTSKPSTLGIWAYAMGNWDGAKYNIGGTTSHGACDWTGSMTCNSQGAISLTLTGATQTPAGTSWGYNCQALYTSAQQSLTLTSTFQRIF